MKFTNEDIGKVYRRKSKIENKVKIVDVLQHRGVVEVEDCHEQLSPYYYWSFERFSECFEQIPAKGECRIKLEPKHVAGLWCTWGAKEGYFLINKFDGCGFEIRNHIGKHELTDEDFIFHKDPVAPLEKWKTVEELEDCLNDNRPFF